MRFTKEQYQTILKRPWRAQECSRATPAKAKTIPQPKSPQIAPAASGVQALKRMLRRSRLELAMLAQIEAERLPTPECEYRPFEHRKFRLDFAWPDRLLGVEVQGSVHRIRSKFSRDIEKRAELMLAGWRVLEVDGDSIKSGAAIAWIKRFLY